MPTSSAPTRSTGSASKRRKRDPKEKRIQTAIVRSLRDLGCFVSVNSQPQRAMCTPGIPDLFVCNARWGLAFWIEVKTPAGKLSTAQRVWHREVLETMPVLIVRSVEELVADLRALGAPIT